LSLSYGVISLNYVHHCKFSQPGFGYQQQLVPGMRPGGAPVPNFFVPMVQQGQQGQRPGGRRGGGVQQSQQPVPLMPQQVGGFSSRVYNFVDHLSFFSH